MNEWFYSASGKPTGPVTREQVDRLIDGGAIGPATLVWSSDLAGWSRADTTELNSRFSTIGRKAPTPPPIPTEASGDERQKSKPDFKTTIPPPPAARLSDADEDAYKALFSPTTASSAEQQATSAPRPLPQALLVKPRSGFFARLRGLDDKMPPWAWFVIGPVLGLMIASKLAQGSGTIPPALVSLALIGGIGFGAYMYHQKKPR